MPPAAVHLEPDPAGAGAGVLPAGRGAEPEHLLQQGDLCVEIGHHLGDVVDSVDTQGNSPQLGCGSIQSYSLSTSSLTRRRLYRFIAAIRSASSPTRVSNSAAGNTLLTNPNS